MNAKEPAWASHVDLSETRDTINRTSLSGFCGRDEFLHLISDCLALLLLASGVIVAAGNVFSIESLKTLLPATRPVPPGSALAFILSGIFLWSIRRPGVPSTRLAPASAIGLFSGAFATLVVQILHWRTNLPPAPGVPSFFAAFAFTFFGGAMFLLRSHARWRVLSRDVSIIAGTSISLLALLGYICKVPSFYSLTSFFGGGAIPLETAILLALLGCGLLCVSARYGLARVLVSPSASGTMIRRLILAPVLIPLVTGLLKSLGLRLGIYNAEFASWLFAYLNILILTLVICWSAKLLYHSEIVRDRAEHALQRANEDLELRVTERTSELSSTEAKFRTLVEQSITGIYAIQDDRLVYVNPKMSEITGFSREELTSSPLMKFIAPQDRAMVANNVRQRLDGNVQHLHYFLRMVRKDGALVHVEAYGALSEYHGRPAILGTLLDVTERKRAEEEIRSLNADLERRVQDRTRELALANKELEAFSYSVSHDLRAPLRHIGGFLQLLEQKAGPTLDDKSRRYMSVISDSVKEMGTLIDNLLSFSRMGRAEMRATTIDLNQLLTEIRKELEPDTAERDIIWKIEPLPHVQADPALLRQVLSNLLSNALKYTRTRPRAVIEIGSSQPSSQEQVFFVRDNGVGFDMQYAEKLFGVFQRLHRAEEFEGTGIGLANVQRIIHRHGGRVWAEAAVDHGATFYFSLPTATP